MFNIFSCYRQVYGVCNAVCCRHSQTQSGYTGLRANFIKFVFVMAGWPT